MVYLHLKNLEKTGEIHLLTLQHKVVFFCDPMGKKTNEISTVIDFKYYLTSTGQEIFAEAKGMNTPVWDLKKKLWIHFIKKPLVIYHGMSKGKPKIGEIVCKDLLWG